MIVMLCLHFANLYYIKILDHALQTVAPSRSVIVVHRYTLYNHWCGLASRQPGSRWLFVQLYRPEMAANPTASTGLQQKPTSSLHCCDFKGGNGPHTICCSSGCYSQCLGALIGLATVISLSLTPNGTAVTWGRKSSQHEQDHGLCGLLLP